MKTQALPVPGFSENPDPLRGLIFWGRFQQHLGCEIKQLTSSHSSWILGLFLFTVAIPGFAQEVTIWNQTATPAVTTEADPKPVEVGVKFRVTAPGHIIGLWYYKGIGNDGPHTGTLWLSDGTLLATTDFVGETASGWQRADFPAPVPVSAGQTYVVSYFAPFGNYAVDQSFFAVAGAVNGSLVLLQNGIDGDNGVYAYSPTSTFPGSSWEASNYWVDPIYISADTDADGDGILNANDNCPVDFNPGQKDDDLDGVGNVCDTLDGPDSDNDGVEDGIDNCPATPNTNQTDNDGDGIGDACEPDADGDGVIDDNDNCPANANPNQEDGDGNGIGDACDLAGGGQHLGDLLCAAGQVASFNGSEWVCAIDAVGSDTLGSLLCAAGQVTSFNGSEWVCAIDAVGNDTLGGLSCSADQVAKFNGSAWVCAAAGNGNNTLGIGDQYGGGIVVWVDEDGKSGIITALTDQGVGIEWRNGVFRVTGATGDGLGAGEMNTAIIIATQIGDNPAGNFAAKLAADYSVQADGVTSCTGSATETCYGDWHLPSKFVLNLMHVNLHLSGIGGFADDHYWSSTERDSSDAFSQSFNVGFQNQNPISKHAPLRVRAVRAFNN